MCPAESHDPIAALNQVLSEVIDVVQEVKQAHRKVPETHALHAALETEYPGISRVTRGPGEIHQVPDDPWTEAEALGLAGFNRGLDNP